MNWPVTQIQSTLGIQHPLIQAPMGGATSPALTAAISNAGGLGMVAGISTPPDRLRQVIHETQARTQAPFGVNLVFKDDVAPQLDVVLEAQVPVVSLFWGDPSPYVNRIHAAGAKVMHTVSSADEAKRSADAGTDILIAQGWEAGGHVPGKVSTLVLIPAVVDAVPTLPVVAAGGIADGRAIIAALTLGAAGVWIGTRFLGAEEACIHEDYRTALFAASETDTAYSSLFNKGWECPHRTLKNSTFRNWEAAGKPAPGNRPGESEIIAHRPDGSGIERYTSATPNAAFDGTIEALPLWAGQGVHRLKQRQPAEEIFQQLVDEAATCLDRFQS